jgi:hypothetical protein
MERCVVKILGSSATSFAACFYNERKVAEGSAQCVAMRNFGYLEEFFIHSPVVMSNYLQKIADHNSMVEHPQKHVVWSYPGKATPEQTERLLEDAKKTLDRLGYEGQPQVFWVHNDTENTHIHAATVTVSVKNGQWIDNYYEGRRARHILDQLRGVDTKNDIDKFLEYKFENYNQFMNLLQESGYRCHHDTGNQTIDIYRNRDLVGSVSQAELDNRIALSGNKKEDYRPLINKLKKMIKDHRRRSLRMKPGDDPIKVSTKNEKQHTVTRQLKDINNSRFRGDNGIDIEGERKAQFKQFLLDLKRELGLSIVFSRAKDGRVNGYTLIDHKDRQVFKGSDIIDLQQLLNPEWNSKKEKDLILSADDAANVADKIWQEKNLSLAIEKGLEELGVDIAYSSQLAMAQYGDTLEYKNREKAVALYNKVTSLVNQGEDITEDGQKAIEAAANEAMLRAVCADTQRQQKADKEAQEKKNKEIYVSGMQRIKNAGNITPDRIGEFVIDFLEDYGVKYDHDISYDDRGEGRFHSPTQAVDKALLLLEGAVDDKNSPEDKRFWANWAIYYAKCAEYKLREKAVTGGKPTPKTVAQKPLVPKAISFLDVDARVVNRDGVSFVVTNIDGQEMSKMLLLGHSNWYNSHVDKQAAAKQLALHYFADEFYQYKRDLYKQECINRYKMPYGIQVDNVRNYITVKLKYPNGDWNNNVRHAVYSDDYRPGETDEQVFIRKFGSEEADIYWNYSFQDIRNFFFPEHSSFESASAVSETLRCFDEIAASFNDSLASVFGAITGAMAVNVPLGGGGGGHNDLPKKKNDNDWVPRNLFGMKPKGRGLGLRR